MAVSLGVHTRPGVTPLFFCFFAFLSANAGKKSRAEHRQAGLAEKNERKRKKMRFQKNAPQFYRISKSAAPRGEPRTSVSAAPACEISGPG
jgi:hypothetical protein